ncbi:MAG: RimK family alpha-L-glutamate ligase [Kofleriaceae bacterium]
MRARRRPPIFCACPSGSSTSTICTPTSSRRSRDARSQIRAADVLVEHRADGVLVEHRADAGGDRVKLRVATCLTLPEVDADAVPLAAAFAAAGVDAELVAWEDPSVDWDAPVPTILRSTWNYALDVTVFLAWIDRVARAAPLWNPADIVRGNVHKRYLLDLAARGVPVVSTTLVERGAMLSADQLAQIAKKIVIKPEVGAGSLHTRVFELPDPAAAIHLASITGAALETIGANTTIAGAGATHGIDAHRVYGAALVQPYLASVDDYGERSLVWIDGTLSHAIRKAPRFAGDNEAITGPFPITDAERAVAEAALAPIADRILYGRVDLARDERDRPVVMELELVEPSLFFARGPGSAEQFVDGLARRLRT